MRAALRPSRPAPGRLRRVHRTQIVDDDVVVSNEVRRVHQAILDAVVAGDTSLARHRMRHHLEALTNWWRTSSIGTGISSAGNLGPVPGGRDRRLR